MLSKRNYALRVLPVFIALLCHFQFSFSTSNLELIKALNPVPYMGLDQSTFDPGHIHAGLEPESTDIIRPGFHVYQETCSENDVSWEGMNNTLESDDNYLSVDLAGGESTKCLYIDQFGLQIPEGAKINAFKILIEGHIIGNEKPEEDWIAMLDENGSPISINYSNKVSRGKSWPQADKEKQWKYGIVNESWLDNIDWNLLNSGEWKLKIQLTNEDDEAIQVNIDQINVQVYYKPLYTLCEEDCGVLFVEPFLEDNSYDWTLPDGMKITSELEDHHIINIMMTDKNYGIKEVCVNVTNQLGEEAEICREILYKNCHPAEIGDYVWYDNNGNGIQDQDEDGVPFLPLELKNEQDEIIAYTSTDETGFYLFTEIDSGHYYIEIVSGNDLIATQYQAGSDAEKDSDLLMLEGNFRTQLFDFGQAGIRCC